MMLMPTAYFDNNWKDLSTQFQIQKALMVCKSSNKLIVQPRSQVLSPTHRETLVGFGHVSPRIWEITNKQFGGGADKCEICLYKA